MIHGKWYGLGLDKAPGWRVAISQGTPPAHSDDNLVLPLGVDGVVGVMEVVERAWEIARLEQGGGGVSKVNCEGERKEKGKGII